MNTLNMTLIESVLIIGSVIGGLMTSMCWNIRRSRCETIESPCVSCRRKPMTEKEMKLDTMTSHAMLTTSGMNRTNSQPDTPKTNLTAT